MRKVAAIILSTVLLQGTLVAGEFPMADTGGNCLRTNPFLPAGTLLQYRRGCNKKSDTDTLPTEFDKDGSHNVRQWQAFWGWRGPGFTIENYARHHAMNLRPGPVTHWGHNAAFNYLLAETLPQIDKPILVQHLGYG